MAKKAQRRKPAARPAARPAASSSSAQSASEDDIVDAALKLAASKGWRATTPADIAAAAGISLAALYERFRSKGAILEAFIRRIDRATLAGADKVAHDDTSSIRDRLFDLFMRRFDALDPHKQAVAALVRELPRHPLASLCLGGRLCRSMAWIASVAGVPTGGPLGRLRIKALAAIYLYAMRIWLRDDSGDHAKTMAALDKALERAEMIAQSAPFQAKRA